MSKLYHWNIFVGTEPREYLLRISHTLDISRAYVKFLLTSLGHYFSQHRELLLDGAAYSLVTFNTAYFLILMSFQV